jgi:hypothetical protein
MREPFPVPQTPEGYRAPVQFQYPMMQLQIIGIVGLIASIFSFGALGTQAQGTGLLPRNLIEVVWWLALIPITFVIHELIHGMVYRLFGYRVYYGLSVQLGAAYAAAFGQFQKRWHNLVAALMPLIVITLIGVPVLTVPDSRVLAMSAYLVLLINTSGAVGDLYISYRLLQMPRHTLLYDVSIDRMLIFYPVRNP